MQHCQQCRFSNALSQSKCLKLRNCGLTAVIKIACTRVANVAKKSLHCIKCGEVRKRDSSIASSAPTLYMEIVQASTESYSNALNALAHCGQPLKE